jgi:hypothetical protein
MRVAAGEPNPPSPKRDEPARQPAKAHNDADPTIEIQRQGLAVQRRLFWATAIGTAILLIYTGFTGALFCETVHANRMLREQFAASERPLVELTGIEPMGNVAEFKPVLHYKNSGKSTALDITVYSRMETQFLDGAEYPTPDHFVPLPEVLPWESPRADRKPFLQRDAGFTTYASYPALVDMTGAAQLWRREKTWIVYGVIVYADAFKNCYATEFCRAWHPPKHPALPFDEKEWFPRPFGWTTCNGPVQYERTCQRPCGELKTGTPCLEASAK